MVIQLDTLNSGLNSEHSRTAFSRLTGAFIVERLKLCTNIRFKRRLDGRELRSRSENRMSRVPARSLCDLEEMTGPDDDLNGSFEVV